MGTLSRIAFYAGWVGTGVIAVVALLLLFQWIGVPELAAVVPLAAIGYGALRVTSGGLPGGATVGVALPGLVDVIRHWLSRGGAALTLEIETAAGREVAFDLDAWVADQISRLKEGHIEIDAPAESRVGREEAVAVAIGVADCARVLTSLGEGRQLQVADIKVGTLMRVELRGDAFDITSSSRPDRLITGAKAERWDFTVVPKKSGTHKLVVQAIVRLRLPGGGEEYFDLDPVEHPIKVRVNPVRAVKAFIATPYVKLAVGAWTTIAATFGAIYGIDPIKEKINALLKPYVDWLFGLFS